VETAIANGGPASFKELAARIYDAGLLRRRLNYYSIKITLTIAALVGAWCALLFVGDTWFALIVAVFLGLTFTQLGFLGHDAGHQQVFATRRANSMLGMGIGNALIGVSYGWWVPKHNAHHAFPNHVGRDPDLDAALIPTSGPDGAPVSRGYWNVRASWRAWTFFPLMLLRSTGLHVLGIQRLLRNRDRAAALEAVLIAAHFACYLTIVFWVLSPLKGLAFLAVQQGVFSVYLGCSFAPNHKGMAVIEGDAEMSFAQRQVTTARNVRGGWLANFALGGLNYQIEHHLFPSMPRPNLARAQAVVRAFCIDNGLGYCEESFLGSFAQTMRQLARVATPDSLASVT
jgi:fatty acid desaturase